MQVNTLFCVIMLYCTCCVAPSLIAQETGKSTLSKRKQALVRSQSETTEVGQQQARFYAPNHVQTINLQISEADRQRMLAALPECIYVPATFTWGSLTVKRVGVRFKGNSSTNPRQQHKRSYLVKFSKYDKQQRFLGMERISMDNGVQFGSLFSEPIITEILAGVGQKIHRCNYAKLFLNDQYQGVYVNAERIDASFIDRNFPGQTGGLWKNDTGGPGGELRYIGDNPERYRKAFEPKNKEAKTQEELRQLVSFISKLNRVPKPEFQRTLEEGMHVDPFLKTTAVMLLAGAFDQLTGWGPHNYYLYHEKGTGKWNYLPWDLDVGFCEVAFGRVYVLDDWDAAWPVPAGVGNPLLERVIHDPQLLARYRKIAQEILEKHFEPSRLCEVVDAKYALIRNDLKTDPFPSRRATVPTDQGYDDIVASIKQFIQKRYERAKTQLATPGPRPQPKHRLTHEGAPAGMIQRLQVAVRKAEGIQRRLHEIQKTMQQIQQLLQQKKFAEAERLIESMERLTAGEPVATPNSKAP